MAESRRLQHCCKGRHCCRDGSCKEVITIVDEVIPEPEDYDDAPPLCICTEPYSDEARRAGMSWGGVSATISGACPLCQNGCPPECRSLKPYGYADAPQWQKDAWDSDTNKLMQAAVEALKDPSTGGWVAPSEVIYAHEAPDPMFPQVKVRRGGIYFPRYRVETMVQPAKKRFLRRQMWQLHVRYWDPAAFKYMHHMMVFASEHDANNAEQIIKFTIKNINDQVEAEKRAR